MRTHLVLALTTTLALTTAAPALAQTWNGAAGGYNTGYGTVYGSFGVAMATQNIYNSVQLQTQRLMMRQAMIARFGLEAVEKAEREASAGKPASPQRPEGLEVAPPPPPSRHVGRFRPSKSADVAKALGEALGTTAEEKALIETIARAARTGFESEPTSKAWKHDVAGALTFFLVGNAMIFHDAPEPSDATSEALFRAVDLSLDQSPAIAKLSDADKQTLYQLLIGLTGLSLATYVDAKSREDAEALAAARALSGQLIEAVLKVDPKALTLPGG